PRSAFQIPGVRETWRNGASLRLEVRDNLDAALKAIARYRVLDLRTEQPSLEDVFHAYYQEEGAMEESRAAT
ncbi:MAG TPA: ABC transporter ATP-binding protein, partial [Dehalococcoidia bacterium]|nr:ABC transporter ATP-binding protein [Dehalococcoidia bacterium]